VTVDSPQQVIKLNNCFCHADFADLRRKSVCSLNLGAVFLPINLIRLVLEQPASSSLSCGDDKNGVGFLY
jgi:hypothetical protein